MHLRYNCITANVICNEKRHPQDVLKELGIIYSHATPQSLYDAWWFWNCSGKLNNLPDFLTELTIDPMKCIGFGVDENQAIEIRDYNK